MMILFEKDLTICKFKSLLKLKNIKKLILNFILINLFIFQFIINNQHYEKEITLV